MRLACCRKPTPAARPPRGAHLIEPAAGRASADRISGDLAITKPQVQVEPAILHEAAVLTDGVPQLAWQLTKLAYAAPDGDAAARAQQGWQQLRRVTEPLTRRQWDTLRHLHSAAQPVAGALALGYPPTPCHSATKPSATR